eukprot:Plantae.Rhodophyta-Purpureofilum_apyrenoidigerum.ctg36097.p1 GENE.Plantae.Rhodophyta-Purpureofilum_apyrenoidigerum.ctg36097~~Plantae.Rhodophyta-Purpureofilum_apyrenoidigerum.ctg36097.p1  ORF type:complete len:369 (-),score=60.45 Plantae.Rhodophyta-Purpureofilum_apyrenoidigerum.ctg36097:208-1314(-)
MRSTAARSRMEAFVPLTSGAKALSTKSVSWSNVKCSAGSPSGRAQTVERPKVLATEHRGDLGNCGAGSLGGKKFRTAVVWLRNELRIDDNQALVDAAQDALHVIVLYVFDAAHLPVKAARFIRDAVADVRTSLRKLDSDLVIRHGDAEFAIEQLCSETKAEAAYFYRGNSYASLEVTARVVQRLENNGVKSINHFSDTLYDNTDFAKKIEDLPNDCHAFSEIAKRLKVKPPSRVTGSFPKMPRGVQVGELPKMQRDGESLGSHPSKEVIRSGEEAALERLRLYTEGKTKTSKGVDLEFGAFNLYLRLGCISPRRIFVDVMQKVGKTSMRRYCTEFDLQLANFQAFLELKLFSKTNNSALAERLCHAGK